MMELIIAQNDLVTLSQCVPLLFYLALALCVSFLCSILEAVLLSVGPGQVQIMIDRGQKSGVLLQELKEDLDKSLSAVLALNTIAHTMGAAGVGAEVASVFGDNYLGLASAVLTILVLVLSEVIPKTLGARYCNGLAGITARLIQWLIILLFPVVWALKLCSRLVSAKGEHGGFSRIELIAIAGLASEEGSITDEEAEMLQNTLELRGMTIRDVMTPQNAVFYVPVSMTVSEFVANHIPKDFARIPLEDDGKLVSYAMYSEILEAQLDSRDIPLSEMAYPLSEVSDAKPAYEAFESMVKHTHKMLAVTDEFGQVVGIVSDEDLLEAIVGIPIADETDLHASPREHMLKQQSDDVDDSSESESDDSVSDGEEEEQQG